MHQQQLSRRAFELSAIDPSQAAELALTAAPRQQIEKDEWLPDDTAIDWAGFYSTKTRHERFDEDNSSYCKGCRGTFERASSMEHKESGSAVSNRLFLGRWCCFNGCASYYGH